MKQYIDTNYFLRLIIDDGSHLHTQADNFFRKLAHGKAKATSSTIVFFETNWVLTSHYDFNKPQTVAVLQKILDLTKVSFPEKTTLLETIDFFSKYNISLEDSYHIAFIRQNNLASLITFDKKLQTTFKKIQANNHSK